MLFRGRFAVCEDQYWKDGVEGEGATGVPTGTRRLKSSVDTSENDGASLKDAIPVLTKAGSGSPGLPVLVLTHSEWHRERERDGAGGCLLPAPFHDL